MRCPAAAFIFASGAAPVGAGPVDVCLFVVLCWSDPVPLSVRLTEPDDLPALPANDPALTADREVIEAAGLSVGAMPDLCHAEMGLILAGHAFDRWVCACMAAAGGADLSATDTLFLHLANGSREGCALPDLCRMGGVSDLHVARYAIRKLVKRGLVVTRRRGKTTFVAITEAGAALCRDYRAVRRRVALRDARDHLSPLALVDATRTLRELAALYDRSAEAAAGE